jgi:hypothetical protein
MAAIFMQSVDFPLPPFVFAKVTIFVNLKVPLPIKAKRKYKQCTPFKNKKQYIVHIFAGHF